jgi:hypothetical protein
MMFTLHCAAMAYSRFEQTSFPWISYRKHGEVRRAKDSDIFALYLNTCFQMFVIGAI